MNKWGEQLLSLPLAWAMGHGPAPGGTYACHGNAQRIALVQTPMVEPLLVKMVATMEPEIKEETLIQTPT